ncbi:hypothetical protein FHX08_004459 [Rhizobium sp. BK529]|uniref:GCG_CRPN prefix-to-repeats domain-containing protein n=1 Tax=unclassified Rhizobium TaxID=2613769 RepID=UPI00105286D3|nr:MULTISPECIES: hypothetical protein [unclassified Rhizobium]MBB3594056.1 hypothetical protein [Rhizobium sp. BK529]TCS01511.1 hypothetical protein EV281_106256 [Rhizobium sp. BK418]
MRKILITTALLMAGMAAEAANATPVGRLTAPAASSVMTVDYACGRGYHLSPRGFCRPNRWAPPPPRYYAPRYYGWERPYRDWGEYRYRERWDRDRDWR